MKAFVALALAFGTLNPTPSFAKEATAPKPPPELVKALDAMKPGTVQSAAAAKQPDHDQGDDHASPRAKEVVCTKDTPAAQRSAICPQPISPN